VKVQTKLKNLMLMNWMRMVTKSKFKNLKMKKSTMQNW